jgi:hypothetical protein
MPQGGDADGNLQLLETPFLKFAQGQIRLFCNPIVQGPVMLFQAGAAITTDLFRPTRAGELRLFPKPLHAFATDVKALANFSRAFSAFPRGDDPLTQILTQRSHNFLSIRKEYQQTPVASI